MSGLQTDPQGNQIFKVLTCQFQRCAFGFDQDNFNYKIYDMEEKKMYITHHVSFNEDVFPFWLHNSVSPNQSDTQVRVFHFDDDDSLVEARVETKREAPNEDYDKNVIPDECEIPNKITEDVVNTTDVQELPPDTEDDNGVDNPSTESCRRSSRNQTRKDYSGMCNMASFSDETYDTLFDCLPQSFQSSVELTPDPKSYKKAMLSGDSHSWKTACDKEMESLIKKEFWGLVTRPTHKSVIQGIWIFRKKLRTDGTIKHNA